MSSVVLPPARDRVTLLTAGALLALSTAAWLRVVLDALRGDDMMMTMPMPVALGDAVAFVLSWAVMMTAMMLPSALPMIALYGAIQRRADGAAPWVCPWPGSPSSTSPSGRRPARPCTWRTPG